MRKVFVPAVFSLFSLLIASAAAQDAAPASSGPVIRTTVSEVALDLVIRDNRGRIVRNLQPSDVEVYENGVKQEVKSFRLVAGLDPGEGGQTGAGAAAGAMMPLRAVNLVCLVFHNMTPATKRYTIAAAAEFLSRQFPPDTYIGVFSLSGTLTPLMPFTQNHNEVMQAARNAFVGRNVDFASASTAVLNASPNSVSVQGAGAGGVGALTVSGGSINTMAVTGADVATGQAADAMRGDLADARRDFNALQGAANMDQLKNMIDMLAQLPGRKTVLLFSPGITQTAEPDKLKDLQNRANKANITFYAVNTLGMTENSNTLAGGNLINHAGSISSSQRTTATTTVGQSMEQSRQDEYVTDAVRTSNPDAPLRSLAEATGGFFVAGNDLRKSYARIGDDVDTHYEVIYHPSTDRYDGRFHKVEVKLARADLNVESRQGYFALPGAGDAAPAPYETAALSAINSETKPHVFDFHAAAYQFRPANGGAQFALAFEVPATSLTATPVPQVKKQRLHVSLLALVKDANGGVVDKISQDFPYEFTEEQLQQVRGDSIRYTRPVMLPPGHYTVETAVLDRESNKTSTETVEFDNPGQKGLGMSSIVLVQSVQPLKNPADATNPFEFNDRRIVPEIDTDLKPGAQPYVYFVVYPDKSNTEKPKIEVEVLHDGESIAKQSADLPAADATGAIQMVVGAPPLPGKDEVKITAMQGDETAVHSLKYVGAAQQEGAQPPGGQQ